MLSQGTRRMDEGLTGSRRVEGRDRSGGMRRARAGAREAIDGLVAGMKTWAWWCRVWMGNGIEREEEDGREKRGGGLLGRVRED